MKKFEVFNIDFDNGYVDSFIVESEELNLKEILRKYYTENFGWDDEDFEYEFENLTIKERKNGVVVKYNDLEEEMLFVREIV